MAQRLRVQLGCRPARPGMVKKRRRDRLASAIRPGVYSRSGSEPRAARPCEHDRNAFEPITRGRHHAASRMRSRGKKVGRAIGRLTRVRLGLVAADVGRARPS